MLTTITLSPDAEARLAILMVPVERGTIATTRTVGAEIAAPSGAALAITAPVAGTLQSPPGVPAAGSAVSRGQALSVVLIFDEGTNLMAARQLVQERLFVVAAALPMVARPPVIRSPLSSLNALRRGRLNLFLLPASFLRYGGAPVLDNTVNTNGGTR